MARKTKSTKDVSNPVQYLDQAKIDAALAAAVTMADGSTPPNMEDKTSNMKNSCCPKGNLKEEKEESKTICAEKDSSTDAFLNDCYACDIDAKRCRDESNQFFDESIKEYIRSINKKIYDETRNGGYSTNINFRVTTQDWVNISHITDWYRTRGFSVIMNESTTPPYGRDVGTMNHNFTISWASAD